MQTIFSDILKPEENFGFNPGEPDDDTFLLETQGSYNAPIPNFEEEKASPKLEAISDINIAEEVHDILEPPKAGSVWDVFEQEQPMVEPATQDAGIVNITDVEQIEVEDNANLNEGNSEYLFADEVEVAEEAFQTQEKDIELVAPASDEIQSPLILDEDLLKDLQKELEISNAKKAEKSQKVDHIVDKEKPIDDEGAPEVFIVLNDIKLAEKQIITEELVEKNIDKIDQEFQVGNVIEEVSNKKTKKDKKFKEKKTIKEEKIQELKQKNDKENKKIRKFIPFNFFKYLAIFILFVAFGLGTYYLWDRFGYKKSQDLIYLAKNKFFGKEPTKSEEHKSDIAKKGEIENKIDVKEKSDLEQEKNKELLNQVPIPDDKPQENLNVTIEKPKQKEATTRINIVNEEQKINQASKTIQPKVKQSITKHLKPDNKIAINIVTETPKISSITKTDEEQTYTIQIYATTSLDDAENWVKNLKMKYNIDNVYITPQTIRDRIWYRVRFGYFSSFEEARTTALKYGFSQSWIDRIK